MIKFHVVSAPKGFSDLIGKTLSAENVAVLCELNASHVLERAEMAEQMMASGFIFKIMREPL